MFLKPNPLAFVREGAVLFSPTQASTVFELCRYENNRNEKLGKHHIAVLAKEMTDGSWLPKSAIDFARLPDGKLTLINGHHRMLAQVQAGKDIVWNIVIHDVKDTAEIRELFWRYDTVQRLRTMNNILDGVSAAESMGLAKEMAVSLSRAALFIDAGMQIARADNGYIYTPADKLQIMSEWKHEARIYQDLIAPAPPKVKKKLRGAQVMGTALVTLRAEPDRAAEFWGGVAKDDGLRRGDPRKTLLDFIRDNHNSATGPSFALVACVRAWNAWQVGKELAVIRIGVQSVQIAGTTIMVQP